MTLRPRPTGIGARYCKVYSWTAVATIAASFTSSAVVSVKWRTH